MSSNLNLTQLTAAQNNKETTVNDIAGQLDAALTEGLTVDFTSGNVSLTNAQFRGNVAFIASNMAAGRTLTVPAIKRLFLVNNPDATHALDVIRGSTTISVGTETTTLFYADGTTNGLLSIAGGGGGSADFVSLTDTPANFTGSGSQLVRVNSGESALEFVSPTTVLTSNGSAWAVPFRGALLKLSANQTGLTWPYIVAWEAEDYDTDDFAEQVTNDTRITIPSGVTRVRLMASATLEASTTAGSILIQIRDDAGVAIATGAHIRSGASGFNNNTVLVASPVLNVTAGDWFDCRINVSGHSGVDQLLAGPDTYFFVEVIEADDATLPKFSIGSFIQGAPSSSEKVMRAQLDRPLRLLADASGSTASADTAANAQTDFDLQKNGASIGTMRFAASGTTVTWVGVSATDFVAGDYVTLVAPGSADSTLADISVTLQFRML